VREFLMTEDSQNAGFSLHGASPVDSTYNPAMPESPVSPVRNGPPVLSLIRDLIFASRVSSTAAQLGVPLKLLRDPARLAGEAGQRLIVDLNLPGAIEAARLWKLGGDADQSRSAYGFVSHVDAETIHKARAAGIDRVMARSQFVQTLPELLRGDTGSQ